MNIKKLIPSIVNPVVKDGFSTENYLFGLWDGNLRDLNDYDHFVLDALCKKVEVTRRVLMNYSEDLSAPVGQELMRPDYIVLMFFLLLCLSDSQIDYKYLNCALKMEDVYEICQIDSLTKDQVGFVNSVKSRLLR
ncbi:hypothetical protein [Motiliproteus sp.]|uniref:hypothetical protein n=1 Tax=Motiliproteus sp. TaxID=1898955 RepID=UPI003BAC31E3